MVRDFVVCFRIRLIVFLMILDIENEDEPIHLDLGAIDYTRRLTELQRRNLSQPKHLRTAYALETMDQDPDDFSASFIRKGGIATENQKAGSEVTIKSCCFSSKVISILFLSS